MSMQSDRAELHRRKDQILEDGVAAIDGDGPYGPSRALPPGFPRYQPDGYASHAAPR